MDDIGNSAPEAGPSSRRGFLRKLGALVAVAVGAGVVPALARAQNGTCCKSNCTSCGFGSFSYFCNGCGLQCCICSSDRGNCFNTACPCG